MDESPPPPTQGPNGTGHPDASDDPRESRVRAAFDRLRNAIDELERALLLSVATPNLPPTPVPLVRRDVMKPREYAERMRVNVRKVHGWVRAGMPHFLVEGRIRIRVADADTWLESQTPHEAPQPPKPARRKTRQGATKASKTKSKAKRDKQG